MTDPTRLPIWRSLLYVPANNERFLAKALQRGADAIILDMEDSVPPNDKETARETCRKAVSDLSGSGTDILVRVNAPLRLMVRDLEAVIRPGLAAVFLPKVESAGALQAVAALVADLERAEGLAEGTVRLVPMIETPAALLEAPRIAFASPRNVALLVGGEDLAAEAGFEPSPETLEYPKLQVAMAAKAAGLLALGLLDTLAAISDMEHTDSLARRSARFGFDGATCVHPAAIPVLNAAFTPTPEAVDLARRTVATMQDAWREGCGAARLEGRMIDMPMLNRAKRLLDKVEQLEAWTKRKGSG